MNGKEVCSKKIIHEISAVVVVTTNRFWDFGEWEKGQILCLPSFLCLTHNLSFFLLGLTIHHLIRSPSMCALKRNIVCCCCLLIMENKDRERHKNVTGNCSVKSEWMNDRWNEEEDSLRAHSQYGANRNSKGSFDGKLNEQKVDRTDVKIFANISKAAFSPWSILHTSESLRLA